MGKKINQLTAASMEEVVNATKLFPIADPVTGEAKGATVAQLRMAIGLLGAPYIANGAEGRLIRLDELNNKNILFAFRESALLFKVDENPDSLEFSFDGIDVTLGIDVEPNQRFLFFYQYA